MNKIKKSYLTGTEESPGLWDGQPSIFCKYDWFTCVFNDVSLKDVLDCIQFFDYDNDDYLKCFSQRILTSVGALPEIALNFNGAHINLRYESLLYFTGSVDLADLDPYKVLNTCLPYIRLDISGSGLDYFRSIGISIDTILNKPFDLPYGSYHPTRADIAFDLIDYAPDFLDQCKEACHRLAHKDTGRVPAQSNGGIKWSERGGDQNTLYLGSVGSDRLLRIYDKKLQFMNAKKYVSSCPYRSGDQLPSSWLRIELQVRRERECSYVLYDLNSFEEVFRYIYDKFAIRELKLDLPSRREPGEVTACWVLLFDWNVIHKLIQNKNFVQFRGVLERSENYIFDQALGNVVLLLATYGKDGFIRAVLDKFNQLQSSPLPYNQRRFSRIVENILLANDYTLPDYFLLNNGVYCLKE